MERELECTKIKDGLYLGNFRTAQDAEFLVTNKFTHIVNCSAEVANFYKGQGIKYLKFKLIRDRPHKLWDESLKKLKKLQKFVQSCEQNSMCCLIHSFDGVNRSLVMLVGLLMSRYRWRLGKTLQFVRSKQIFIGLSEHYIDQLQKLEQILSTQQPPLTSDWKSEYYSIEEEVLSKTYLNSQEIEIKQNSNQKQKKQQRVVWKDLAEKERKKEQKQLLKEQQRQRGIKVAASTHEEKNIINLKQNSSKSGVNSSLHNKIKADEKDIKEDVSVKRKAKSDQQPKKQLPNGLKRLKINGNRSKPEIGLRQSDTHQRSTEVPNVVEKDVEISEQQNVDQLEIINLIKKNLKSKKKMDPVCINVQQQNQQKVKDQKVYNVTINNYIKPNINILNKMIGPDKKKLPKKRPQSAWKKQSSN